MHPKPWRATPLLESIALSKAAGCRVFLKREDLQPSGSFKSRGMGNYLIARLEEKQRQGIQDVHFYCSSGGNAGLAAVTAAVTLGMPCTVVVPTSTKPMMLAKIMAAGAHEVIQIGANWSQADTHLRENILAKQPNGVYVPPFDHPDIWAGHATMIKELHSDLTIREPQLKPSAVVCSVGGGGLFAGVMTGLDEVGWSDVSVIALETRGAESLHKSVQAGELVTLPAITSLATTLGASRVAEKAFEFAQRPNVKSVVLEDAEAVMGCRRLADDERVLVEPSCGVTVALCYEGKAKLELALGKEVRADDILVIILCGGSGVSLELLNDWRATYGEAETTRTPRVDVPSDFSADAGIQKA